MGLLGSWDFKDASLGGASRFPITQGSCDAAVQSRAPVVAGDVTNAPRYLTTFGTTRSEMIVPITDASGSVTGLLDVESERVNAFGEDDLRFLQACAAALAPVLFRGK